MSVSNITKNNNLDLFCKDITVDGNIIVSGGLDIQDAEISGDLTIGASATINYVSGSIINGDVKYGNSAVVIFDNTTDVAIEGSIAFPVASLSNINVLYNNGIGDTVATSITVDFYRIGDLVTMFIPNFTYTLDVTSAGAGFFYFSWSSLDSRFIPASKNISPCIVVNDNQSASGYIYCNTSQSRFEIRCISGAGTPNVNDHFNGTNGDEQGLSSSFLGSTGVTKVSYEV